MSVILGENGELPTTGLTSGHLTLTEDGDTLATEIYDCEVSNVADIVILLDHSTSMLGIVGDRARIYEKFYESISTFIGELPFGARYSLLPYTDSITANYPQVQTSEEYYRQGSAQDSINCITAVRSLVFYGNTNVDAAIPIAIKKLTASGAPKKIIVLITDDFTLFPDSLGTQIFRAGIKAFVMETGKENAPTNFALAQRTGGTYYQAVDTLLFGHYMKRIAEHIKAEHCMLRYTTNKPCGWNTLHTVGLTLDYKNMHQTKWHSYVTPPAPNDTIAPVIVSSSPTYTSRVLRAQENYPCERGLQAFGATTLSNFTKYSIKSNYPYQASDSLEVINPALSAYALYTSKDSAGNESTRFVYYVPPEDSSTIQPLIFSGNVIDFGRNEAPADSTISLTLRNPNLKPITIKSITSNGNTKEIIVSLPSMKFEPLEEKKITVRFSSALLGDYNAKFILQGETSILGSLNVQAQSFGRIHVWIDSSKVGSFGDTGSIVLRFRAKPNPINLDTLRFTLNYDSDLIEFITSKITCSPGSVLCTYSIRPTILANGKLELKFIAGSESYPIAIDSADSYLILPLRTYLAKDQSSLLSIDNYYASYHSPLSSTAGVLTVDDGCGDSYIRSYLNDKNALRITSISKSSDGVGIDYTSATDGNVTLIVSDIMGRIVTSQTTVSKSGHNTCFINSTMASGSYILTLENSGSKALLPFAIIK